MLHQIEGGMLYHQSYWSHQWNIILVNMAALDVVVASYPEVTELVVRCCGTRIVLVVNGYLNKGALKVFM